MVIPEVSLLYAKQPDIIHPVLHIVLCEEGVEKPVEKHGIVRACLEVVLLKRKSQILGSHEGIFSPHSSATGRKNGKVRFQEMGFAAKMTTSKHALSKEKIKIFFFLVNDENNPKQQLRMLSSIIDIAERDHFIRDIFSSKTRREKKEIPCFLKTMFSQLSVKPDQ